VYVGVCFVFCVWAGWGGGCAGKWGATPGKRDVFYKCRREIEIRLLGRVLGGRGAGLLYASGQVGKGAGPGGVFGTSSAGGDGVVVVGRCCDAGMRLAGWLAGGRVSSRLVK
jgi:hypothetical protein